jgi:hypothetical protein
VSLRIRDVRDVYNVLKVTRDWCVQTMCGRLQCASEVRVHSRCVQPGIQTHNTQHYNGKCHAKQVLRALHIVQQHLAQW